MIKKIIDFIKNHKIISTIIATISSLLALLTIIFLNYNKNDQDEKEFKKRIEDQKNKIDNLNKESEELDQKINKDKINIKDNINKIENNQKERDEIAKKYIKE